MLWKVERTIEFDGPNKQMPREGYVQFGFHDSRGRLYAIDNENNWVGHVGDTGNLTWTAGPQSVVAGVPHLQVDLKEPHYITDAPNGRLLIASSGNSKVYTLDIEAFASQLLIDGAQLGMQFMGNCVVDNTGSIWINEVKGCKVHKFSSSGEHLLTIGNGMPGFQKNTVPFDQAQFNWIYDLRLGPNGNIYVLDSRNYAVRMIDPVQRTVSTVAGIGTPGYSGDGGDPLGATFGSDPSTQFDGPWSLAIDEAGTIYVGDTYNKVIRAINPSSNVITTICSEHDGVDLYHICSLDYYAGRLFIPLWNGELVVIRQMRA